MKIRSTSAHASLFVAALSVLAFGTASAGGHLPGEQVSIFLEDFESGIADWADVDYVVASQVASGGHDGGAYGSASIDIDTTSGGAQGLGGYTAMRCGVAPSQNPALNCSAGGFIGDWYFTEGVQVLKMYFRHNSAKPGGIIPQVRVATPGNTPGGSAIFPAVQANTWTLLEVPLDTADPLWDPTWGAVIPDATKIFRNVGRVQLGYFIDPSDPLYQENSVTFDIDDVEIRGVATLTAEIRSKGSIHPHHDGSASAVAGLNDPVRARVLGALQSAGDPADIPTANIVQSTVRIGPIGGAATTGSYGLNEDNDGIADAEFTSPMSAAVGDTYFSGTAVRCIEGVFGDPLTKLALRAELTSGEIVAGEDLSLSVNCDAVCHTN